MNSARPGHDDERRRARPCAAGREPGDHAEQDETRHARRRPTEDPAHDRESTPGTGRCRGPGQAHPRAEARQLHRQLAAQHDDRADVLERRREPQLTDERRPPLGRLDRHVADEMQARARARPPPSTISSKPSGSNSSGQSAMLPKTAPAWRPDASAPRIAAATSTTRQQRALPRPQLHARRDQRSAVAERDGRQAEQRAAGRPRRARSGQPVRGEHAADGADDRADEQQEPSWRMAGPRMAVVRSTGASSTCRTSARSSASGPPRLPDRSPTATTTATTTASQSAPSVRTCATCAASARRRR